MEQKLKVLHLEDHHRDSELITRQLNKSNMQFENLAFDTKTGLLSALQKFSPDIVLADNFIDPRNSMEALKIVKENKKDIPFLLVTNDLSEDVRNIMNEGAKGYILKDNLDTLPEAIRRAMDLVFLKVHDYPESEVILPEEKLYDLTMLEEMEDNEYLTDIISTFLSETPRELKEMRKAAISGKASMVAEKAHKLKSNTGLLEAHKLTKSLVQIEKTAKSGNQPHELIRLVNLVITDYREVENSLKNYIKAIPQH